MAQNSSRRSVLAGGAFALMAAALPLRLDAAAASSRLALRTAGGREVAIWEWLPRGSARGTILFSHGAASAPRHYERLLLPWSAAGYRIFAPLHVDSAEHPHTADFPGLASWAARIEDMRLLSAHLGGKAYVAAGHSYGGLTAIALGGGVAPVPAGIRGPLRDPQARAVVALSPPAPIAALTGETGYAPLAVPAFVQTGTRDLLPGTTDPDGWKGHLAPFDAASADGRQYALVLDGADHYFGGLICRPDAPGPQTPEQLDQAIRLSQLFIDGFAARSRRARRLLDMHLTAGNAFVGLRRK